MDLLAFCGVVLAFVSLGVDQLLHGSHLLSLVNFSAFTIVVGGSAAAILLQTPAPTLKRGLSLLPWVFFPPDNQYEKIISQLTLWGKMTRQHGLFSIEDQIINLHDPFLKKGAFLILSNNRKETIKDILQTEIKSIESQDLAAARIYENMGGYSPTFGVLGAVLGLIHAMNALADPNMLGQGIAVAFIATVYGVGFANFFLIPISNRLKCYVHHRTKFYQMYVSGLNAVLEGDHPKVIETRMRSYRLDDLIYGK